MQDRHINKLGIYNHRVLSKICSRNCIVELYRLLNHPRIVRGVVFTPEYVTFLIGSTEIPAMGEEIGILESNGT